MKNRLLTTTAICGLMLFANASAFAACDTGPFNNGDTASCSGVDLGGFDDSANTSDLTLNVDNGSNIGDIHMSGDDNKLYVDGAIIGLVGMDGARAFVRLETGSGSDGITLSGINSRLEVDGGATVNGISGVAGADIQFAGTLNGDATTGNNSGQNYYTGSVVNATTLTAGSNSGISGFGTANITSDIVVGNTSAITIQGTLTGNATTGSNGTLNISGTMDGTATVGINSSVDISGTLNNITGNNIALVLGSGTTANISGLIDTQNAGHAIEASDNTAVEILSGGFINGPYEYTGGAGSNASMHIYSGGTMADNVNFGGALAHFMIDAGGTYSSGSVTADGSDNVFELTGTGGAQTLATGFIDTTYNGFDSFVKSGTSTWTLTGTNAKDWRIDDGTLAAAYTAAGNISGTDGTFQINNASGSQQDFTGNITGGVDVLKSGGDSIRLTGTNSFTGALTVNGSTTLVLEDAAAASATSGINIDQATLAFDAGFNATTYDRNIAIGANDATFDTGAHSFTLSGVISGASGRLIKAGNGTLTLTGSNTYGDGTYITGGTVVASADENLGTGTIFFGGATLRLGAAFDTAKTFHLGSSHGAFNNGGFDTVWSGTAIGNNALFLGGTGKISLTGANGAWTSALYLTNSVVAAANSTGSGVGALNINNSTFQYLDTYNQSRNITVDGTSGAIDTNGFNSTLSGTVTSSNAAYLEKKGTGTLTLSADNSGTLTNGVHITGGTLEVSASNNLGSAGGSNNITLNGGSLGILGSFAQSRTITIGASNGAIRIVPGETLTQNGALSGSGTLTKSGTGTLILNADSSAGYSGLVNINGGTVRIGGSNRLGDGSGTNTVALANGGVLSAASTFTNARDMSLGTGGGGIEVTGANTFTQTGVLSGSTDLTTSGTGTLILDATNTNSGKVIVTGGSIVGITSASSLGDQSATNDIELDNGSLRFINTVGQTHDIHVSNTGNKILVAASSDNTGVLSGSGDLEINNGGDGILRTLNLIGTPTFTGNLNLVDAYLNVNMNSNWNYAGSISGSAVNTAYAGGLTKSGTGTLTLTGTSSYAGSTTINNGKLVVNGTLSGTPVVDVSNGGTLGGSGTVRNVSANSGGTIAPGNSIGTLNVTGTVDFHSGSHYAVEYDNTSADKIIASGAVTINGGAILDLTGTGAAGTFAANQTYTILEGSSVTGIFGTVNNNLAFLDATQDNTGTTLDIILARNDASFSDVVKSPEQDVAKAAQDLGNNDLTAAITGLTAAQTQTAMEQLSNQHGGNATAAAAASTSGVMQKIETRLAYAGSDLNKTAMLSSDPETYVAAYMEPADHSALFRETEFWAQALGSIGRTSSDSDNPATERHSYGMMGGVDIAFGDKGIYGFFLGYEQGEAETDTQYASSDIGNYHLGAYAKQPVGDINVSGGAVLSYHTLDTQRYIVIPGFQAAPQSDTDGYTAGAFVEVSKDYMMQDYSVTPFAAFSITHSHINGYTERNGGTANLAVDDANTTNPSTTLGARIQKDIQWNDKSIAIGASFGWQHVFGNVDPSTDMRFAAGTTGFSSSGAPRARDQALLGLGAAFNVGPGMNAFAGYDGTLSVDAQDHGVKAGVKIDF